MGVLGGTVAYRLLRTLNSDGITRSATAPAYEGKSKLAALLGSTLIQDVHEKVVIDFGCGTGAEAIELAELGAQRVIGIDIQEHYLAEARRRALAAGVGDRCQFETTASDASADVIVSLDAFEHFVDPGEVLRTMHRMLAPDGVVVAAFGPTWYHPFGGHFFSVFPWSHLIFTERALIRWRSDFKSDGATRFEEVAGGLNKMTIARFERIVRESPLRLAHFEAVPIRAARMVATGLTREFTTSVVRCKLVPRS